MSRSLRRDVDRACAISYSGAHAMHGTGRMSVFLSGRGQEVLP
jgi:hypothetical protein